MNFLLSTCRYSNLYLIYVFERNRFVLSCRCCNRNITCMKQILLHFTFHLIVRLSKLNGNCVGSTSRSKCVLLQMCLPPYLPVFGSSFCNIHDKFMFTFFGPSTLSTVSFMPLTMSYKNTSRSLYSLPSTNHF